MITTILEFQREFDVMQHYARREPVEITRHGRRAFVLMSAVLRSPQHVGETLD
jgi:prevent-host-death family protein